MLNHVACIVRSMHGWSSVLRSGADEGYSCQRDTLLTKKEVICCTSRRWFGNGRSLVQVTKMIDLTWFGKERFIVIWSLESVS